VPRDWTNTVDRLNRRAEGAFGRPLTLSRAAVTVAIIGILDIVAYTAAIDPVSVQIEGCTARVDIRIASVPTLGRPQQEDRIADSSTAKVYVVRYVEDSTPGGVYCHLQEVEA